jgi:plasmid stabilization system protein ParE
MTGHAFHPEARTDLDQIYDYIAADSPNAADRVVGEILAAIRSLAPFPGRGHKRLDLTSRALRFIAYVTT